MTNSLGVVLSLSGYVAIVREPGWRLASRFSHRATDGQEW